MVRVEKAQCELEYGSTLITRDGLNFWIMEKIMTGWGERSILGKNKYKNKGAKLSMADGDEKETRLTRILIQYKL